MIQQNSKGLCTFSAIAGAAVVLQGSSALALPSPTPLPPEQSQQPQASWSVAQELPPEFPAVGETSVASSALPLAQPINALRSTSGLTSNWATLIAQPEQDPGCCFSEPAALAVGAQNSDSDNTEIYLLLALTLWFGATAPWVLQRFWWSQQQLAYGHAPRRRPAHRRAHRRAHHQAHHQATVARPIHRSHRRTAQRATTSLYYGSYAGDRFAKPRASGAQAYPHTYPIPQQWQPPAPQPVQVTVEPTPAPEPKPRKALPALQPA